MVIKILRQRCFRVARTAAANHALHLTASSVRSFFVPLLPAAADRQRYAKVRRW